MHEIIEYSYHMLEILCSFPLVQVNGKLSCGNSLYRSILPETPRAVFYIRPNGSNVIRNFLQYNLIKRIYNVHKEVNNMNIGKVFESGAVCGIDFETESNNIDYKPGTVGVIPPNTEHKVAAGKDGLFILAKFTPALL